MKNGLTSAQTVHALLAESQLLFRNLLAKTCQNELGFSRVVETSHPQDVLPICDKNDFNIAILGLNFPGVNGLDIIRQLTARHPHLRILVLTSRLDPYTIMRLFECNIYGVANKNTEPLEQLRHVIQNILDGKKYYSKSILESRQRLMEDPLAFPKILSRREQEMLTLFAEGLSNQTIADQVGISPKTAQGHRHNIMRKLEIHDTPGLMRYAIEKGFWSERSCIQTNAKQNPCHLLH